MAKKFKFHVCAEEYSKKNVCGSNVHLGMSWCLHFEKEDQLQRAINFLLTNSADKRCGNCLRIVKQRLNMQYHRLDALLRAL